MLIMSWLVKTVNQVFSAVGLLEGSWEFEHLVYIYFVYLAKVYTAIMLTGVTFVAGDASQFWRHIMCRTQRQTRIKRGSNIRHIYPLHVRQS